MRKVLQNVLKKTPNLKKEDFGILKSSLGKINQTFVSINQSFEAFNEMDIKKADSFEQMRNSNWIPSFIEALSEKENFKSVVRDFDFRFLSILFHGKTELLTLMINRILRDPLETEASSLLLHKIVSESESRELIQSLEVHDFYVNSKQSLDLVDKIRVIHLLGLQGVHPKLQIEVYVESLKELDSFSKKKLDFNSFLVLTHHLIKLNEIGYSNPSHVDTIVNCQIKVIEEFPMMHLIRKINMDPFLKEEHPHLLKKVNNLFMEEWVHEQDMTVTLKLIREMEEAAPFNFINSNISETICQMARENIHFLEVKDYFLNNFIMSSNRKKKKFDGLFKYLSNELLDKEYFRSLISAIDLEEFGIFEYYKLNRYFFYGLINSLYLSSLIRNLAAQDVWDVNATNLHLMNDFYQMNLENIISNGFLFLSSLSSEDEFDKSIVEDMANYGIVFDAADQEHALIFNKIKMIGQTYILTLFEFMDRFQGHTDSKLDDPQFLSTFFKIQELKNKLNPDFKEFLSMNK